MKIMHPLFLEPININNETKINNLVVENQKTFTAMLLDISNQINQFSGEFVLSSNHNPIDIHKSCELITTFVPFDINRKNLLNKLMQKIQSIAISEDFVMQTHTIKATYLKYIYDILEKLDYSVDISDDFDISYILKGAEVKFSNDYDSLAEKLIDYMITVNSLENEKCYVLVNLRCYLNNTEVEEFYRTALYNKLKILIISGNDNQALINEKKTIIDKDLCQI
jgi:CRISPR type II-A-associated protein Csn2